MNTLRRKDRDKLLDKQYHLYSVDTGHFYSNHERYLYTMNRKYRQERKFLKNKSIKYGQQLVKDGYITAVEAQKLSRMNYKRLQEYKDNYSPSEQILELIKIFELIIHKRKKAQESKDKLNALLTHKIEKNIDTNGLDHSRGLEDGMIHDTNVVSMFDGSLSRTLGIKEDELTDSLVIVRVYYFEILKDILFFGFMYNGERYRYYTSSAGQIRNRKAVLIKESEWDKHQEKLMCGLTIDKINEMGGININKFLAYLALSNSATDEWAEFDIDKAIVIDDFETNVWGEYDFIDDTNFLITRKQGYVPIPHTDGSGMILPDAFGNEQKNTMVRLPWIKGLLSVFSFDKFILEHENDPENPASIKIKDIWGKEWDIFEDDIQVIFTKSQFKLAKFYSSWQDYKDNYKKYSCTAGRCNIESDRVKNAKINYQMLQSLVDITEEEVSQLTKESVDHINNICTSQETMLDILGVTPYNTNPNAFQQALKLYPTLLSDTYSKDVIRGVKNSLLRKYRSGKLDVKGKYAFALPDFYAACEFWFQGIKEPKGLLDDGEVFCWLTRFAEKVDCLRSPHLDCAHAVRKNIAADESRRNTIREWFTTNGIYTSTHDLISKILQLDVDGDQLLVVSDKTIISVAERTIKKFDIVPLYYNMKKAEPAIINPENIYKGLTTAFTGGNIGEVSNDITKIWNDEVFVSGTFEEQKQAIDCIKRLTAYANFVVDFAKTLYKPKFPDSVSEEIKKYTKAKLPAFFEFAKNKGKAQICERNKSFVNQIYDIIPDKFINTKGLKLGKIDYKYMMRYGNVICDKEVADLYDKLNRSYRYMLNMKDEYADNLRYVACELRKAFSELGYSNEMITDMLVEYLYGHGKRYKQVLWFCYGQYIVNNLTNNLYLPKKRVFQCAGCGEWFEVEGNSKVIRCENCRQEERRSHNRKMYKNKKIQPS